MIFEMKKKIYGYECDIYGHLNNANYLQVYEAARSDALKEMNVPIQKFKELGIHLYVIRIEVDYKLGIQLEDIVTVKSQIGENNRLGAVWIQKIFDSQGRLCSQAKVRAVYTRNAKPSRIDKELSDYFAGFMDPSGELHDF